MVAQARGEGLRGSSPNLYRPTVETGFAGVGKDGGVDQTLIHDGLEQYLL